MRHLIKRQFKLGTTSFIFPDYIIPNVEQLGPYFDEIELLVFESEPSDVLPAKTEIKRLNDLSKIHNVSYNIHLPTDIDMCSDSEKNRQKASDTYVRIVDSLTALNPTTCTLHLPMQEIILDQIHSNAVKPGTDQCSIRDFIPDSIRVWQDNLRKILGRFASRINDPQMISIETLNYPFEYVEDLIKEFKFTICIDAGHQIKYGFDLNKTYQKYKLSTPLIHLHGVDFSNTGKKDHTSLDRMSEKNINLVKDVLKSFTGVVSLEVFSLVNLNRSLTVLSQIFEPIPDLISGP